MPYSIASGIRNGFGGGWRAAALAALVSLMIGGLAQAATGAPADPAAVTFNRAIRPIISDRCFSCHGPDSTKRKAELRFDRESSYFDPLPKDPDKRAFVPGKPDQSEVYRRITSSDPDVVMPPAKSHLKLDATEKEQIRKWIEQGAKWEQYWAFIAPVRPELPAVKDAAWPRNDMDRFVLAKLEKQGLHPAARADKPTLIRRVSLALTGIPPTPAQVDAFLADPSSDAYEKVVDRLLASPNYGEQMATQWLDYARYADSHGFQSDPERHMWRWRDWVINAYNKNMPFDEFTIEQLAGDLLPNATVDQKIATGFNRNHRINDEGGIIAEEWRVEGVIDRAETTSEVWLGLTMGCCRCHDHKFDPLTQKDFYSFCAFFNSVNEVGVGDTSATDRGINVPPILKLPSPEQQKQLDALNAQISLGKATLADWEKHSADATKQWEQQEATRTATDGLVAAFPLNGDVAGHNLDGSKGLSATFHGAGGPVWAENPQTADGPAFRALQLDGKGAAIDAGDAVALDFKNAFSYSARVNVKAGGTVFSKMDDGPGFRGFDLRVESGRVEAHLIHQWPEDAIKVISRDPIPANKWVNLLLTYDGSQKAEGVKIYVNGNSVPLQIEKNRLTGTLITTTPLWIGKRVTSDPFNGQIADVQFFYRALPSGEAMEMASRPAAQAILRIAAGKRSAEQKQKLAKIFRESDERFADAKAKVEDATKSLAALDKQIPDTMVMEELPKPRDTFILVRGQYNKHGEKVTAGLPAVLPPMPAGQPMNRLGMARWLVDPANPLTARVQANRLWAKFFGVGIVKTANNLGTQSDVASSQQLLDWLATEMLARKWDLKAFQKEIVMSATYRQSSTVTPDLLERDPENRLLARGPRFRLSAEIIRDQALAVSGLLVQKIGGPSVRPYEPANLWEGNLFGNLAKYDRDKGDGLYRRSMYTFIKRTATPSNLTVFDQPSREYCVIQRSRTDTPLQALDLMNDPQYVEASRAMAQRMMIDGGSTPVDRITYGFRRATDRIPSAAELRILSNGFQEQMSRYKSDPQSAAKFISIGDSPRDPRIDPAELAAYTMTASVILNLDEVINLQ